MALEQGSGRFRGEIHVEDGALWLNGPYATQAIITTIHTGSNQHQLDSVEGLQVMQPVILPNSSTIVWAQGVTPADNTIMLTSGSVGAAGTQNDYTFLACGSAGRADVFVSGSGELRGTGGTGGSVFINAGGVFNPGTPDNPAGAFNIGNDLTFANGASWHVVALDTETCNSAQIANDVWLAGEAVFEYDGAKRPKGTWVMATYEGTAHGNMTAPQGCKVRIDELKKEILFTSSETGTLFLVR